MIYDNSFYDRNLKFQKALSDEILPWIMKNINPKSAIDFGCGCGYMLEQLRQYGCVIFGLNYNIPANLQFPKKFFKKQDFSIECNFVEKKKFDLVVSLEVAEHLEEKYADTFIDNLCKHGDTILFSAATPGQGGEGHVNEQPELYWETKFNKKNFKKNDIIRPFLKDKKNVPFWYRQNIFLYKR